MSAFAAWCLIWPAGECLCQTITIKCAVVRADQDIGGGKGIIGTGLIAPPVSNKEHGQGWGQALEPWNWLRLYLRKTDLNWTLLRWKMLILCIFPPNIESWRLGSPETYNLASTDFLNTWEERGKRLRRYQRIRNGLLQTCRQGFNDNVVLVQSNRLSDIPVTRNDLNLSLNAESELVKFCSRKKLLMKDLLIVAQSYIWAFCSLTVASNLYNLRCFMVQQSHSWIDRIVLQFVSKTK